MDVEFPKRRLFIHDGENYYQILSFTQSKSDASIYVSSPEFSKIKWLSTSISNEALQVKITDTPGDGKLSLHGSGMTKITPNIHELVVHGNYLLDIDKQALGVRHLFTIQLAKPSFLPSSPALNRDSDLVISTKKLSPSVIVFFAIPRVSNLTVNFKVSFDIDDLDSIPPEGGYGCFELLTHNIFWYAYRTKRMDEWAPNPYICYYDGNIVPIMIGTGDREMRIEFRTPNYKITNAELFIEM